MIALKKGYNIRIRFLSIAENEIFDNWFTFDITLIIIIINRSILIFKRDTNSLWNIDQRAILYPADIQTDESSLMAQYV